MVISMLTIGGLLFIAFFIVEWKLSRLPMIPIYIFKNPPVAAILIQQFFFGIIYYGYLYYLPLYYQNARQFSTLESAYLTIPLTVSQSIASICTGQYMSRFGRYGELIWSGFVLVTITTSLTASIFSRTIEIWKMVVIFLFMGVGHGNIFQPGIIAVQAHSPKVQRAIVISIRNFLRCLGGAVGLAVSAAILQAKLRASLPLDYQYLAHSAYAAPDFDSLNADDTRAILQAYTVASKSVFTLYAPCAGICLLLCLLIKDNGLVREEEREQVQQDVSHEIQNAMREPDMTDDNGDIERAQVQQNPTHNNNNEKT